MATSAGPRRADAPTHPRERAGGPSQRPYGAAFTPATTTWWTIRWCQWSSRRPHGHVHDDRLQPRRAPQDPHLRTRGEVYGDGEKIALFDFLTDKTQEIDTTAPTPRSWAATAGRLWLMHRFVAAVARNDPALILSGPQETLESHLIVFAAEQARNTGRVVPVRR